MLGEKPIQETELMYIIMSDKGKYHYDVIVPLGERIVFYLLKDMPFINVWSNSSQKYENCNVEVLKGSPIGIEPGGFNSLMTALEKYKSIENPQDKLKALNDIIKIISNLNIWTLGNNSGENFDPIDASKKVKAISLKSKDHYEDRKKNLNLLNKDHFGEKHWDLLIKGLADEIMIFQEESGKEGSEKFVFHKTMRDRETRVSAVENLLKSIWKRCSIIPKKAFNSLAYRPDSNIKALRENNGKLEDIKEEVERLLNKSEPSATMEDALELLENNFILDLVDRNLNVLDYGPSHCMRFQPNGKLEDIKEEVERLLNKSEPSATMEDALELLENNFILDLVDRNLNVLDYGPSHCMRFQPNGKLEDIKEEVERLLNKSEPSATMKDVLKLLENNFILDPVDRNLIEGGGGDKLSSRPSYTILNNGQDEGKTKNVQVEDIEVDLKRIDEINPLDVLINISAYMKDIFVRQPAGDLKECKTSQKVSILPKNNANC